MRAHGYRDAHSAPLVSFGKNLQGDFGGSWRVPSKHGWKYPSIELRAENSWPAIVLDVDRLDAHMDLLFRSRFIQELPEPSWIVYRLQTGGAHAVWCLASPVHRGLEARSHPLKYLARCAEWLAQAISADRNYNGVLSHNPYGRAKGRRGRLKTIWGRRRPYSLAELREYIPKGWRMPRKPVTAEGRNWALFLDSMKWAGSPRNLGSDVLDYALDRNYLYKDPRGVVLGYSDVACIARSVERYRGKWIEEGRMGPDHSPDLQAERGVKSGAARRAKVAGRDRSIVSLAGEGHPSGDISELTGIPRRTVSYVLQRDAPLLARRRGRQGSQPWLDLGVPNTNGNEPYTASPPF